MFNLNVAPRLFVVSSLPLFLLPWVINDLRYYTDAGVGEDTLIDRPPSAARGNFPQAISCSGASSGCSGEWRSASDACQESLLFAQAFLFSNAPCHSPLTAAAATTSSSSIGTEGPRLLALLLELSRLPGHSPLTAAADETPTCERQMRRRVRVRAMGSRSNSTAAQRLRGGGRMRGMCDAEATQHLPNAPRAPQLAGSTQQPPSPKHISGTQHQDPSLPWLAGLHSQP